MNTELFGSKERKLECQIFTRKNKTLPLITDKKIQDQGIYKYIKIDGYYVLSGTDSQHRLLNRMNKDLDLGLIIE